MINFRKQTLQGKKKKISARGIFGPLVMSNDRAGRSLSCSLPPSLFPRQVICVRTIGCRAGDGVDGRRREREGGREGWRTGARGSSGRASSYELGRSERGLRVATAVPPPCRQFFLLTFVCSFLFLAGLRYPAPPAPRIASIRLALPPSPPPPTTADLSL